MNISRMLIAELRDLLRAGAYDQCPGEFDKLATEITEYEKDRYYRRHPEETYGTSKAI